MVQTDKAVSASHDRPRPVFHEDLYKFSGSQREQLRWGTEEKERAEEEMCQMKD